MISYRQMYDFAVGQIAWYEKQQDFERSQIDFCNHELKRTRKEDRELREYALATSPDDEFTRRIYGDKNYMGRETRKYVNERSRHYRAIKHNEKRIAYYRKEAEYYERYIG